MFANHEDVPRTKKTKRSEQTTPLPNLFDITLGSAKSTIEPTYTHGIYGVINRPNAMPLSWFMITNGRPTVVAGEAVRMNGGAIGTALVPVIPDGDLEGFTQAMMNQFIKGTPTDDNGREGPEGGPSFAEQVTNIPWIQDLMPIRFGNGMLEHDEKGRFKWDPTALDLAFETINRTPEGIVMFSRDTFSQHISVENIWFQYAVTMIQNTITQIMIRGKARGVTLKQVGYGNLAWEENAEGNEFYFARRPSASIKYFDSNEVQCFITQDPFTNSQLTRQFILLNLAARMLREFMPIRGKEARQWTLADYAAMVNSLLLQFVGSADISQTRDLTAFDIMDRVMATVGIGISEADRYQFTTPETWAKWFRFCIVFGILLARMKGTTANVDLRLVKSRTYITIAADLFNRVTTPPYMPGGGNTPWYIQARNHYPNGDIPVPCVVGEEDGPCDYKWLRQPRVEYSRVESRFGMAMELVETDPLKEVWKKVVVHYDVQRYTLAYPQRDVILWKFDYAQSMFNDLKDEDAKWYWLYGLFYAGMNNLADGYAIVPKMELFATGQVDWRINALQEPVVAKSPTTTAPGTEQQVSPGVIPMAKDSVTEQGTTPQPVTPVSVPVPDVAKAVVAKSEEAKT